MDLILDAGQAKFHANLGHEVSSLPGTKHVAFGGHLPGTSARFCATMAL